MGKLCGSIVKAQLELDKIIFNKKYKVNGFIY